MIKTRSVTLSAVTNFLLMFGESVTLEKQVSWSPKLDSPSERQLSSGSLSGGCAPRMVTLRNFRRKARWHHFPITDPCGVVMCEAGPSKPLFAKDGPGGELAEFEKINERQIKHLIEAQPVFRVICRFLKCLDILSEDCTGNVSPPLKLSLYIYIYIQYDKEGKREETQESKNPPPPPQNKRKSSSEDFLLKQIKWGIGRSSSRPPVTSRCSSMAWRPCVGNTKATKRKQTSIQVLAKSTFWWKILGDSPVLSCL